MSNFDQQEIFYSNSLFGDDQQNNSKNKFSNYQKIFKNFVKTFSNQSFTYPYRDQLKRNCNLRVYFLKVLIEDISKFDEELADVIWNSPNEVVPILETSLFDLADQLTQPRSEDDPPLQPIQLMLFSQAIPKNMRDLKSDQVSKLVKISGIVVAASQLKTKAYEISIQCRTCRNCRSGIKIQSGLEGFSLPRKCDGQQVGPVPCPIDPYFIMPDKCKCIDFQTLKIQELPEDTPNGEMPRHILLYCDRNLSEIAVPGNRVTVVGIYSIKKMFSSASGPGKSDHIQIGIRNPYVRVVGIEVNMEGGSWSTSLTAFSKREEEMFRKLASLPNIYDIIVSNIAPSIYGCQNIKKALACMLFSGSRKTLPDGLTRRGDINILMLGDPGTAKSQLLKFVENVSPIGVYTSGKGSSAAGLTAAVIRDPSSRNFIMEGGAMVLADGGIVCIDEFDKMREDDRVAIHEAMEQQTISIAKAGITTTLNSRCGVLAAANSVFGRWDDTKGDSNIDFMPTILSRFDMIFIIKDEHMENKDITMAKHVINIHMSASNQTNLEDLSIEDVKNPQSKSSPDPHRHQVLQLNQLKKFIAYCRMKCGPRISDSTAEILKSHYIKFRQGEAGEHAKNHIPITVRQLEAIIRISEALAKMQLQPFVTESHLKEAIRLFKVSTMAAANNSMIKGAEGFTSTGDQELFHLIEKYVQKKFASGSQISESALIHDLVNKRYPEKHCKKVISTMIQRGELQWRQQRKMLYRVEH